MKGSVIALRQPLYEAKPFSAATEFGTFKASGTLCGCVDLAVPGGPTFPLTPDEASAVVAALQGARADVLAYSNPLHDPRILP